MFEYDDLETVKKNFDKFTLIIVSIFGVIITAVIFILVKITL